MDQTLLDRIIFCGKVVEDLSKKLDLYNGELKIEDNKARAKAITKQITHIKATLREYKVEQNLLAMEK